MFEKLCNCVLCLTPKMILNCFIFSLIPEVRHELVVLQPTSITQAINLTKLLESKSNDTKHFTRSSTFLPQLSKHLLPPPSSPFSQPTTPSTSSSLPIKIISSANFKNEEQRSYVTTVMQFFSQSQIYNQTFFSVTRRQMHQKYRHILSPLQTLPKNLWTPLTSTYLSKSYLAHLQPTPLSSKVTLSVSQSPS